MAGERNGGGEAPPISHGTTAWETTRGSARVGVNQRTAEVILAEIGADMCVFPTAGSG